MRSFSFWAMASLPFTPTPNPHFSSSKPTKFRKTSLPKPKIRRNLYEFYFHSISSLCKQGQIRVALTLLNQLEFDNLPIGPDIYGELLQGCVYKRALFTGQQIHARIIKNGVLYSRNEYIETKLLIFYAKCGVLEIADGLFWRLRVKNEFSWAAMIGLRCRMGFNEEALMGFCGMVNHGILADNFVVPNVLKACGALKWIGFGRAVHGYSVKTGSDGCVFVSSSLVDVYGKCGVLDDARKVFDNIPEKNVVTWNSMIVSNVQNGFYEEAIRTFFDMRLEGVAPSRVTLSGFLSASANLGAIEEGKQGHAIAVLGGFELDNILGSSILNFYCKVGLIEDAELVFHSIIEKDTVTWNLLVSSYVQCEQALKALNLCHLMRSENMRFDSVTLASILSASANTRNIEIGKAAHCYVIRNSLASDVVVKSSIIDMYAKCKRLDEARLVFDITTKKNLMIWNLLLAAYAELGLISNTLTLFYKMQLESMPRDEISWNTVILGYLRSGQVNDA